MATHKTQKAKILVQGVSCAQKDKFNLALGQKE